MCGMMDTTPADPVEMTVVGDVYTTEDDLGDIPDADMHGDQTGGLGPL
jgi:hypothetical protein